LLRLQSALVIRDSASLLISNCVVRASGCYCCYFCGSHYFVSTFVSFRCACSYLEASENPCGDRGVAWTEATAGRVREKIAPALRHLCQQR
ncbi:hypothetical protein V5799_011798, partial [Amblyomma americanum]